MLRELHVQNIAVIQKASIEFGPGFNVFTGETGAGKTILISAIDAVLGQRTSRDVIRTGEERAFVSALFDEISPRAREKLTELGFEDDDGAVLISREITQSGKTSCKIGGMPATVSMLREVASLLIHIHGQRDSDELLLSENHLDLLDLFGGHDEALAAYRTVYSHMKSLRARLDDLNLDDAQKAQRVDMLTFQIQEIEDARLSDENEEDELTARKKRIRNAEKILSGLTAGYEALTGGEENGGIESLLAELETGVAQAAQYIDALLPSAQRVTEIGYELSDIAAELRDYLDDFEFDPRELDEIEKRLDEIYKLKRKYGATIAEIIQYGRDAQQELDAIESSDETAKKLELELAAAETEAKRLAACLTEKRLAAGKRFTALVEAELAFLDMPSVQLGMQRKDKPLSQNGCDELAFMIVTNVGEEPKPLAKIASGGEVARVMLAIKNVLADRDEIDTLIFDEVDTGVSGRAAQKVGAKLKQASQARQVICVTHLAQVAAFADHHLLIHKEIADGRTFTRVSQLDNEKAVEELARITGGDLITELSLQSARELWKHSQQPIGTGKEEIRNDTV